MFNHIRKCLGWCPLLMLLAAQAACTVSPAPKAECDSNLRPINPTIVERQRP
jgi:hypothetical protein